MQAPERNELPDLDEWLEHIDTVVLGREQGPQIDPPVEEGAPSERRKPQT